MWGDITLRSPKICLTYEIVSSQKATGCIISTQGYQDVLIVFQTTPAVILFKKWTNHCSIDKCRPLFLFSTNFRMFLRTEAGGRCEKSLSVLKDGEPVRTWLLSEKDGGGRQFFDESFWRNYVRYDGNMPNIFTWVFDIGPEDIGAGASNE